MVRYQQREVATPVNRQTYRSQAGRWLLAVMYGCRLCNSRTRELLFTGECRGQTDLVQKYFWAMSELPRGKSWLCHLLQRRYIRIRVEWRIKSDVNGHVTFHPQIPRLSGPAMSQSDVALARSGFQPYRPDERLTHPAGTFPLEAYSGFPGMPGIPPGLSEDGFCENKL